MTSDVNDRARAIDTLRKEGVIINEQRCHLDPAWVSPLDERDVRVSLPGQEVDWCGRWWKPGGVDTPPSYKLSMADNLLMKLVESLTNIEGFDGGDVADVIEDAGRFAQQLRSARFEFRFDPEI